MKRASLVAWIPVASAVAALLCLAPEARARGTGVGDPGNRAAGAGSASPRATFADATGIGTSGPAGDGTDTAVAGSAPVAGRTIRKDDVDVILISFGSLQGDVDVCGCHLGPKGGLSRRALWLDSVAKEQGPYVQLDLGDFSSTDDYTADQDTRFVWKMMERLKVDATAIGPRELTEWSVVKGFVAKGTIPFVCSNVSLFRGGQPEPIGETRHILQYQGVRIALFSLMGMEQFQSVPVDSGARFTIADPFETARRMVPELRREADLVILMSQMSTAATDSLVRSVPGIDVALYGHDAPFDNSPSRVGQTIANRTGIGGQYAGKLVVTVDPSGRVKSFGSANRAMDKAMPQDPEIARLVTENLAEDKRLRTEGRARRQAEFERKLQESGN